jgi:hypothetical protein|tara:strand:- start:1124 stop:1300 length:177 start_codon:yes stop_codon:yes gene_type:complete
MSDLAVSDYWQVEGFESILVYSLLIMGIYNDVLKEALCKYQDHRLQNLNHGWIFQAVL